jgi:TRAP-type C4-dicarboxylate transport system substrate-binding protein
MQRLTLPMRLLAMAVAALLLPATASAEKILRYTDHEPLGGMRTKFIKDVFFAAVEKESNGRLKIQPHWNGALAASYDALKVLGRGSTADIGIAVPEYTANELPLHQIFKSFPKGPTGDRQIAFFRRVYAEVPAFPAELKANNVVNIFFATGYPVALFSANPLTSLTDMKGDKWRTASFWHRDFLRNAGATPVTMPWGVGVFNALKAKTLDGLIVNIDSGYMLKVHEAAPHVVASKDLWLGHVYLLVMNADTWAALAQEDKEAIQRAAETAYKSLGSVMDNSFPAMVKDMEKEGVKIRLLTGAEVDGFEAATKYQDVQAAWVKAQEAKGVKEVGPTTEKVRTILKDAVK